MGHEKEDTTAQFVKSSLTIGSIFVDVGSNIGYFSLLATSLGARVVAYASTPAVFNHVTENFAIRGFDSIALVNAAVADKPGKLVPYQSPDDPGANNLFGDGRDGIEVQGISLDEDLAARGVAHVDLLKIDAEGAEPMVLDGAARLLSSPNVPTIAVEINPIALRQANFAPSDIFARLEAHGYRFTEIEPFAHKGETVVNIVASPSSNAAAA